MTEHRDNRAKWEARAAVFKGYLHLEILTGSLSVVVAMTLAGLSDRSSGWVTRSGDALVSVGLILVAYGVTAMYVRWVTGPMPRPVSRRERWTWRCGSVGAAVGLVLTPVAALFVCIGIGDWASVLDRAWPRGLFGVSTVVLVAPILLLTMLRRASAAAGAADVEMSLPEDAPAPAEPLREVTSPIHEGGTGRRGFDRLRERWVRRRGGRPALGR